MFNAVRDFLTRFKETGYPDFGDTDVIAVRKGVEGTIGLNELYEIEAPPSSPAHSLPAGFSYGQPR